TDRLALAHSFHALARGRRCSGWAPDSRGGLHVAGGRNGRRIRVPGYPPTSAQGSVGFPPHAGAPGGWVNRSAPSAVAFVPWTPPDETVESPCEPRAWSGRQHSRRLVYGP